MTNLALRNNAHIAVIGAGPAGSFFAITALKEAAKLNKKVNITLFDRRRFSSKGPRGCNMCAGIIQSEMVKQLNELDLPIPSKVKQGEIKGYAFCIENLCASIIKENPFPITTVFRGGGPTQSALLNGKISFDHFLLEKAVSKGARFENEQVKVIKIPSKDDEPFRIIFGNESKVLSADLLIGAFGVNSRPSIAQLIPEYQPPENWHAYQAEIFLGQEYIQKKFRNMVHICFIKPRGIKYLAAIPKGDYLTITAIGKNVNLNELHQAINHSEIRQYLPDQWRIKCYCHPWLPVTAAFKPYANRLIIIGDASYSRFLKNGIHSAYITAHYAAKAALNKGISEDELKKYYDRPCRKKFVHDNLCGRFLLHVLDFILTRKILSHSYLKLVIKENQGLAHSRRKSRSYLQRQNLSDLLWNLYTGDAPYKHVLLKTLSPVLLLKLGMEFIKTSMEYVPLLTSKSSNSGSKNFSENRKMKKDPHSFIPLEDNATVAIIGGGPAGTSCAIALAKEAKKKGKKVNVVLFEQKDFNHGRYFNQCLGVLSPPLLSILKNELDLELTPEIIIKEIEGYILHSDSLSLNLNGEEHGKTYAVRRINFDNFMLESAKGVGVKVIQNRVTDIDFTSQHVMVYSEGENCAAQVVVGAFGLDDGSCKIFERNTKYRQPEFLNAIVTKLYLDEKKVVRFGPYIHAFLPRDKRIEYAAITPKKDHLSINIVGKKVYSETMLQFLKSPPVQKLLPSKQKEGKPLNYYKGKFPIAQAKRIYGERYVIIGDAAGLIRPFKGKGINSSCLTGIKAAKSITHRGVSQEAFAGFYQDCHELTADLPYGKILRHLAILTAKYGALDPLLELAKTNAHWKEFLFNCVSAQKSYKKSIREISSFKAMKEIGLALGRWLLAGGMEKRSQD